MTPVAKTLKQAAGVFGARTVGVVFVGFAAKEQSQEPGKRVREKARLMGERLVRGGRR